MAEQKITTDNVKQFKSDAVGACPSLVTLKEQAIVRGIPDEFFEHILVTVFNSDTSLARDVMYNRIDRLDDSEAEAEVAKIRTLSHASEIISDAVVSREPILMVSDIDNDGSLALAMGMEFAGLTDANMTTEAKNYNPEGHGFSVDQISEWALEQGLEQTDSFTVLVADLGTNQKDEQDIFLERFPNGKLIIADHHQPDPDKVVLHDSERSVLVSPFIKGSMRLALKGGGGVSGSYLSYMIMKMSAIDLQERNILDIDQVDFEQRMIPMKQMAKAANFLDYVSCDVRLKPLTTDAITKALDLSASTNKGKSVPRWISGSQVDNLNKLQDLIGEYGVSDFLRTRDGLLEANHFARALIENISHVTSDDSDISDSLEPGEKPEHQPELSELVALNMSQSSPEESATNNYVELLRPYIFNFNYESQLDGSKKKDWLTLASEVLKNAGGLERELLEKIRKYELVSEISDDFVLITKPATPAVGLVFTDRQRRSAYHSATKPINLSLKNRRGQDAIFSYQSNLPITDIVANMEKAVPGISMAYLGHSKVGSLTVGLPKSMDFEHGLEFFAKALNAEVKKIIDAEPAPMALMVKPIHLETIKELFQTMRVHVENAASPLLMMQVEPNMVFTDKYTMEKKSVSKLIEGREWEMTTEPLNFGRTSSLMIPNQALKAIANDGYGGALGVSLLPTGNFMGDSVFTNEQLKNKPIASLRTPLQKEQEEMAKTYKKHFKDAEKPLMKLSREESISAIKFIEDGHSTFERNEALVLATLDAMNADSYVTLDAEGDGQTAYNLGLSIYRREPGSGALLTKAQFERAMEITPEKIKSFREEDGKYRVNERMESALVSIVINRDGNDPIRISFPSQNLTNMDQNFLDEYGMSASEGQEKIVQIMNECGSMVVQGHNLPYDRGIVAVNFPEVAEILDKSIHVDSAPLAKNEMLAYSCLRVNSLGGFDFFNSEHQGYNLSSLLRNEETFDYPSLKGDALLQVRKDDIYLLNLKTKIPSKLEIERDGLADVLLREMTSPRHIKYGIETLLRTITIKDMISKIPKKETNLVEFNAYGLDGMPDGHWEKIQDNYCYHLTVDENVELLSQVPSMKEFLSNSIVFEARDSNNAELFFAREVGAGDAYSPEKKFRSKAAQAKHQENIATFNGRDIVKANLMNFAANNPENVERHALTWAYDLVLSRHETTRKIPSASFISGVSDTTGVPAAMISDFHQNMYEYKKRRGLQSYKVHETHNNVGPEGDVFQESHVSFDAHSKKVGNPYLDVFSEDNMTSLTPAVNALHRQAAESTLVRIKSQIKSELCRNDVLNSASAKMLDHFSKDGISSALTRDGIPQMRSKTLSTDKAEVHIELPNFDATRFRSMSEEDRRELEEAVDFSVTAILLANSRFVGVLGNEGRKLIEDVVTHPDVLERMSYVQDYFGKMEPTSREAKIGEIIDSIHASAITGSPIKIPVNKFVPGEDIDVIKQMVIDGLSELEEKVNYASKVSVSDITEALDSASLEYDYFSMIREVLTKEDCAAILNKGEPKHATFMDYKKELNASAKRQITTELKSKVNVMPALGQAIPDLANAIPNTKKDPMGFMLCSPLSSIVAKIAERPDVVLSHDVDKLQLDDSEAHTPSFKR